MARVRALIQSVRRPSMASVIRCRRSQPAALGTPIPATITRTATTASNSASGKPPRLLLCRANVILSSGSSVRAGGMDDGFEDAAGRIGDQLPEIRILPRVRWNAVDHAGLEQHFEAAAGI